AAHVRHRLCRGGHELHQPARAGARHRTRVVARLLTHDGRHEERVEPGAGGGLPDLVAPAERIDDLPERAGPPGIPSRAARAEVTAYDAEREVVVLVAHVRAGGAVEPDGCTE